MARSRLSVFNQHARECNLRFFESAKAGSVPLRYMADAMNPITQEAKAI